MAKKHFEEEEKPTISYAAFVFMLIISFWLGMSIEAYHIKKHLPKCSVQKLQKPPIELPNGQAIEDIKKLEVFVNNESH